MRRLLLGCLICAALAAAAHAQIWIMSPANQTRGGKAGPPPVSCASTGIFNLNNVCNDIYFIGALK